jgi:xylan 1,4-beta-xylosidase
VCLIRANTCNGTVIATQSGSVRTFISPDGVVSVHRGKPGNAETFQGIETFTHELKLMQLATRRCLHVVFATGALRADSMGPKPDGSDGRR